MIKRDRKTINLPLPILPPMLPSVLLGMLAGKKVSDTSSKVIIADIREVS